MVTAKECQPPDPLPRWAAAPSGDLGLPGLTNRSECGRLEAGFHWESGTLSWLARRVGSHSVGKHGAWLLTETREEQVNRHTSWTGSQQTPPTALTSHTPPGEEALPR
jgi:hypothetical protein